MTTLVLVGPHGAGKTTLGTLLAQRLGWPFDDEIGRRLREEALLEDPDAHAMAPDGAFDRRVFEAELLRDRARSGVYRVVETWHPGNLAYAGLRSPALARRWLPLLADSARRCSPVVVVPLRIARPVALARLSEPGPSPGELVDFFAEVARRAEEIAAQLGARVLPPVDTGRLGPGEAVGLVVEAIQSAPGGRAGALFDPPYSPPGSPPPASLR